MLCAVGLFWSCDFVFESEEDRPPLARAGDRFLYHEDVAPLITDRMSPSDSAVFVTNYINNWARKQLLLTKSKINLPEEQLAEFDRLVEDYKADLYTKAYLEALVQQSLDTVISDKQLRAFYNEQKENFKLDEKLLQLRFVVLPKPFLHQEEVVEKIKTFNTEDKQFLDSIAVQFKKLHLNDSIWVSAEQLMREIPVLNYGNQDVHLRAAKFFELQDSLQVYMGKVVKVLEVDDIAPLEYIAPRIKRIMVNRRLMERKGVLENDVLKEAIRKKEFEIYGNNQ